MWNSLNVDTDHYRAVYKNYTDKNGRDFPMMIGRDIYYFDEVLRTKMIVRDLVLYLLWSGQNMSTDERIQLLMFLVSCWNQGDYETPIPR